MSFWKSGTGEEITGEPSRAFMKDFGVIPDGTKTLAKIINFVLVEKVDTYRGPQKFYEILWKITEGDFKAREVSQKIKAFYGKPEQIDRALNMLKLIMGLCQFKPTHSNAPTDHDLKPMVGTILGVQIREWSMEKQDGSGFIEGNYVGEVHHVEGFESITGKKIEVVHTRSAVDSAFDRNPRGQSRPLLEEDIPF